LSRLGAKILKLALFGEIILNISLTQAQKAWEARRFSPVDALTQIKLNQKSCATRQKSNQTRKKVFYRVSGAILFLCVQQNTPAIPVQCPQEILPGSADF